MILVVAGTMARARQIAAARAWPRSAWRYVRSGDDIDRQPRAALWLDRTAAGHPRTDSIADAVMRRLNPGGWPQPLPPNPQGTGTLRTGGSTHAHA